jgi:hypothetical protein
MTGQVNFTQNLPDRTRLKFMSKNPDLLKEQLDEIRETIKIARNILNEKPVKSKKKAHNVFFVAPHIKKEYSRFETDKTKTVLELLEKYKIWSFEISAMIVANQGKLHHPKLYKHLDDNLRICETLDYALRTMFKIK